MGYVAPTGTSHNFSVHLAAEVYAYVIGFAKARDVTRNGAINAIIAEHADAERRRAERRLRSVRTAP